ncbi:MAG: type IV-A pilus assembly ATPase PilB [Pseudomonadota bacterium]|nr:type IV-A pilus assembly ATPase PilB [Pseudomonadota bacterium]|tara:strand:+ start:127412 stop:129112 length:1701 start_codon:yes stop_codon:yes gene_type:complete
MSKINISGLAKRLVRDGILTEETAVECTAASLEQKIPFVSFIVKERKASAHKVALAAADEFGAPVFDIQAYDMELCPKDLVENGLIQKHRVMPLFKRGNRLFLGVADPTNLLALDEIKFNTGLTTEAIVVEEDKLQTMIDKYLDSQDESMNLEDTDLDNLDLETVQEETPQDDPNYVGTDDAPVVKFVNKMLLDAIKMGASDIHFEPYEKAYRVRFRMDGILKEMTRPPVNLSPKIAARLKVMSSMDISERRIPQDGRIKLKLSKTKAIDFRVNTLPTLFGEKICLRQLDPDSAKLGIDMLGYEDDQKALYLEALAKPQGMILVTGPTGSGKTVSLYTGLNILNTPERNISTAEDPVEINLEGINQVNVRMKVGLDFGTALRAFLRQDPDVVMVGEIRDLETAQIAIKAAQTGHLVLSTLHTNSAAETLTRLRNMGVPAFNIATSVSLIIAQRLARRLCNNCKTPLDLPHQALREIGFAEDELDDITIYGPVGCDKCVNGYKGRTGIYEVVKMTEGLSRIIMSDGNSIEISDKARSEGYPDLRAAGLKKAKDGVTSLEEVNRVTSN